MIPVQCFPVAARRSWRIAGILVASLGLGGCLAKVGPEYQRPNFITAEPQAPYAALTAVESGVPEEAPTPASAPTPNLTSVSAGAASLPVAQAWWGRFNDPVLSDLVALALSGNPDIQVARSRRREAAALLIQTESDGLPRFDAALDAGVESSRTMRGGRVTNGTGANENGVPEGNAGVGGVLSWTLDLFGGQARAEEAAAATGRQRAYETAVVRSETAADVVRTYVGLRGTQQRLALARDSLALQRDTLRLVQGRVDAGLAPDLDQARAASAVFSLEAEVAPLETDIRLQRDALAVLAGLRPGALDGRLSRGPGVIPTTGPAPEVGLPAELLRNRADLRAAEEALVNATAGIGVAESALYPSLSLPGRLNVSAAGIGTGDIATTVLASLGAVVDIPLFDFGAREAAVTAAEEQALQAAYAYRSTLLDALAEVEGALHRLAGARTALQALRSAVAANRQADAQARALYGQGLASFLDVLDTQRDLTSSLQRAASAEADEALALADLYAALGLGDGVADGVPDEGV